VIKSRPKKRDWRLARKKLEDEQVCRVCRRVPSGSFQDRLEAAHIIARRHDQDVVVNPLHIIPLCTMCHLEYDARKLEILPFLTPNEQGENTRIAGGSIHFLKRVSPLGGEW